MSKDKFQCIHCGGLFVLSQEGQIAYEEGYIGRPDCCDDCCDSQNSFLDDVDSFGNNYSDADPGL
jgi:hypothetical protein